MEAATEGSEVRTASAAGSGDRRTRTVLLVVPPFLSLTRPSLNLGQLSANLRQEGIRSEVHYSNFGFAERIGMDVYESVGKTFGSLLGEFVFSHVLFGRSDEDIARFAEDVLSTAEIDSVLRMSFPDKTPTESIRGLMDAAADFCRGRAVDEILARDPWLVGISSTFQQNCASLSLLAEVKRRRPDVVTVMGGANCEGEMGEELFRRFREIDHLGQGECDSTFVELVRELREGRGAPPLPGFRSRDSAVPYEPPHLVSGEELDRQPYPDYDEYFARLERSPFRSRIAPELLIEMSRGCWWGAKHHCTFCGLNGESMAFRKKSESRIVEEINALVSRHGIRFVFFTDLILDMGFFKTLLPRLEAETSAEFFVETKANLNRPQVRQLASSRIKWIQPGLESFSDESLETMRKGSSKLTNVQLLKWAAEFGVTPSWGYLYGFPGEREEEMTEIAAELETLHHLEPPSRPNMVRLDRFSPYFERAAEYGLEPVRSATPYRHIYDLPEDSLARVAYFRESDYLAERERSAAYALLTESCARWRRAFERSYLLAVPRKRTLFVLDTRSCSRRTLHRLRGLERSVYEYCEQARSLQQVQKTFEAEDAHRLLGILEGFVENRLMLHSRGRYLGLAVGTRAGYTKLVEPPSRDGKRRGVLRRIASAGFDWPRGRALSGAEVLRELGRIAAAFRLSPRRATADLRSRSAAIFWRFVSVCGIPILVRLLGSDDPPHGAALAHDGESGQVSAG